MGCCCCCTVVATAVGVLVLVRWLALLIDAVIKNFKSVNLKKYGSWAAVTGCTSGIGEEYAKALAGKGLNVILVGRNETELARVQKEINEKTKVNTKTVKIDFSKATSAEIKAAAAEINVPELGILVNNAGVSYEHPEFFDQVSLDVHKNIIQVNINSIVELTHAILPTFVQKKKGAIINVSSLTGVVPVATLATYSASKAFVEFFTQALSTEYSSKGIFIATSCPGLVATKMSKMRHTSLMVPSAKTYAASGVNAIGVSAGSCAPYFPHNIQKFLAGVVPPSIIQSVLFKQHLAIREKALSKKSK